MKSDERAPQRLRDTTSWQLTQAATRANRFIHEAFLAAGTHRYQYALMCAIDEFGPCSQADLCRRLHMDRKDVAVRTAEMEDAGYIHRELDSNDPRRRSLRLAAAGRRRLDELAAHVTNAQTRLFATLSTAEQATLRHLLERVRTTD